VPLGQTMNTGAEDFLHLPELTHLAQIAFRLVAAAVLGGLVGAEREWVGKAAGLRTHMLVSLGAALFVLAPAEAGLGEAIRVASFRASPPASDLSGLARFSSGPIAKRSRD
jgi:uncharacterized membrane protein YhiD involved in acid resistance